MAMFLLAPTEADLAECFGDEAIFSSLPESRGADVLVLINHKTQGTLSIGIQRKKVPEDFEASTRDGRLARELPLLQQYCTYPFLVPEGVFTYDKDNHLCNPGYKPYRLTKQQVEAMLRSVKYVRGVDVERTSSIKETAELVRELCKYFSKIDHSSLTARPKLKGLWGVPSKQEQWEWLLQGFDRVGIGMAKRILTHFGRIPLQWTCTVDELMEVPKIGKATATRLWRVLQS